MATVALSSTVNSATDGDTYVSSAQTYPTRVFLDSTFDAGDVVRVEATSTGPIEVLDSNGRRIGFVAGESAASFVLNAAGSWLRAALVTPAVALVPVASDLATATTLVNALRTMALAHGWMKAE